MSVALVLVEHENGAVKDATLATVTAAAKLGDVHLTWENEAHLEVAESQGELELVYPKSSIRAEPRVAMVDANVDRKGTREVAQAYLEFLYTPEAQEIIAKNHYRPSLPEVLKTHEADFPAIELFPITRIAGSWKDADEKFFGEGAVFDQIVEADPEDLERLPRLVGNPEVEQTVGELRAEQELRGKVTDRFGVREQLLARRLDPTIDHAVADGDRDCHIPIIARRRFG